MQKKFYIPFSKKAAIDIINKSNGTLFDNIVFYAKVGNTVDGGSFRCGLFPYDQFINCSFNELEKLGRRQCGPQGNANFKPADKKNYHGSE